MVQYQILDIWGAIAYAGFPPLAITVKPALSTTLDATIPPGSHVTKTNTSGFHKAVDAASKTDVVFFFRGNHLHKEAEFIDRPGIQLPSIPSNLLKELSNVNPIISLVGLDSIVDHVSAIVSAGYPGQYAGEVLPDGLFGRNHR